MECNTSFNAEQLHVVSVHQTRAISETVTESVCAV